MLKKMIIAGVLSALPLAAQAEYPNKPVEFIVPWPPGDLEDVLTRMIAEDFEKEYGVPAAVVNRPGGGGGPFPGAISVAQAPADGYTIGSFVMSVAVVGPQIGIPELNPNPFEPIGAFVTYPFVIAAGENAPYDDIEGLAAYSQKNGVTLGHFGAPFAPTRVTMAFAERMGISFESDAAFDALDCNTLASRDVDVISTTIQLILPCLDDLKVLATIGSDRISLIPDVPAVGELQSDLGIALWNGLFVHKDTPADVRDKIEAVAEKTMASERVQALSADTGALVYWQNAEDTEARLIRNAAELDAVGSLLDQ
ncbi:MAG: tripartite tricarboxylate transporter substrate binding protein [Pseudoruegeria sp.]